MGKMYSYSSAPIDFNGVYTDVQTSEQFGECPKNQICVHLVSALLLSFLNGQHWHEVQVSLYHGFEANSAD